MQLIIKDGFVIATHGDEQDVAGLYDGCEVVSWSGPKVLPVGENGQLTPDPRTDEQKAAATAAASLAATRARHLTEADQGVTLANGWRMRYVDEALNNYMQVKNLIDLAGASLPGVTIYDADSQSHALTPAEAMAILAEYAVKVALERQRQFSELAALGW